MKKLLILKASDIIGCDIDSGLLLNLSLEKKATSTHILHPIYQYELLTAYFY